MLRSTLLAVGFLLVMAGVSHADIKSKAAREAAEYLLRKFGKEAAKEGVESLSRKIETLAIKHGDEAFEAVRKIGPRTFHLVEEAGEHGAQSIKLLARGGEDAIWVVAKKNRMAIFLRFGDDAAQAMIKHGELAEPLLQSVGKPAVGAFSAISRQNGRRLAMMAEDRCLPKSVGQTGYWTLWGSTATERWTLSGNTRDRSRWRRVWRLS